jgi:HD-GYP domain-containing protein (c-di-GMP phosphodiesterase class II)
MTLPTPASPKKRTSGTRLATWQAVLERANQVAWASSLEEMETGFLALAVELSEARAGALFVSDQLTSELVCRAIHGESAGDWLGCRLRPGEGLPGGVIQQGRSLLVEESTFTGLLPGKNLLVPLLLPGRAMGVLQLAGFNPAVQPLLEMVADRLAPDFEKWFQLEAERLRVRSLNLMIGIFQKIGATLDRDQILWSMVDYARAVIGAEASSLFLVDEQRGDIVLHVASNENEHVKVDNVRVPAGKGIIGSVIETGQVVLVPDTSRDERHYGAVDQTSGFVTRSILAVPLRSRQVELGGELGTIKEHVVGGIEALNKIHGAFNEEDAELLTILANQAATVLEIAGLYSDARELFLDVIQVVTAAIDAKDPYTEGHSQRVSEFSVHIAREMGLPAEIVSHLKIGSLLHDVGKIGISDTILGKPARLTDEEFAQMKRHPEIGEKIMQNVRMLKTEMPAITEHHERLDGRGYPKGLKDGGISLFGRIVAVADVFDALTSQRPYRKGQSAEEALDYLMRGAESEFDRLCVEALVRAYTRGVIHTQAEMEQLNRHDGQVS